MKHEDNDYLAIRDDTDQHLGNIPDRRNYDERQFDSLIEAIFYHQKAVFELPEDLDITSETNGDSDNDITLATSIAKDFYEKHFVQPELVFGRTADGGADVEISQFVEAIISNSREGDRNAVFFLLGEIGVGKSAFINWVITTRFVNLVKESKIWFVRIDLEDLNSGEPVSIEELVYYILLEAQRIIRDYDWLLKVSDNNKRNIEDSLRHSQEDHFDIQFTARIDALARLSKELLEAQKRRFILILDNIDYICHANDRGLFHEEEGNVEVIQNINEILQSFTRKRDLGHLGVNVLITARTENYDILNQTTPESVPKPAALREHEAFTLRAPDWTEVIENRCKLLESQIEDEDEGKKKKYLTLINAIKKQVEKTEEKTEEKTVEETVEETVEAETKFNLMNSLKGITNKGLREVMIFFAQYGWIGEKEVELTRFIHAIPVALLTFMLRGKTRYSQEHCSFPNIYLVNPDVTSGEFDKFEHSYWLKVIILKVLYSENGCNDLSDLLGLLSKSDGYNEYLVKECLGILTTSFTGRCINVRRSTNAIGSVKAPKVKVKSISVNERGSYCLDNIFDRFFYLQLVVEDHSLPIPRCVLEEFEYKQLIKNGEKVDYSYVILDQEQYKARAKDMVSIKAKQVTLFLEILEVSLELEKAKYRHVFERLERRKIAIPDVSKLKKNLKEEFEQLNPYIDEILDIDKLFADASKKKDQIRSELTKVY